MVSDDQAILGRTFTNALVGFETARQILRVASMWSDSDRNPETAAKDSIAAGYWLGENFVDYKQRA